MTDILEQKIQFIRITDGELIIIYNKYQMYCNNCAEDKLFCSNCIVKNRLKKISNMLDETIRIRVCLKRV